MKNEAAEVCEPRSWPNTPEQRLVKLTFANPSFKRQYKFPLHRQDWQCIEGGCSSDAAHPERMLSIDCEMVKCEYGEEEIVQVCVVDRDCKVLLDTIVKPRKRVVDYLTRIHGITAAEMSRATCTQEMAQAMVCRLLKPGTILIGHSLYHDLRVLKINYRSRLIDTSLLFRRKEGGTFSLNELCETTLGYKFRDENKPHNCRDDATIPMKIILNVLEHGPGVELLEPQVPEERLFIHKIPPGLTVEDLIRAFPSGIPCTIKAIQRKKFENGLSYAVFSSKVLTDNAFNLLSGELGVDSHGRQHKKVTVIRASSSRRSDFFVRKMSGS